MYTSVLPLRKARSQQETIKTSQVNYKLQPEHKSEVNEKKKRFLLLLNFYSLHSTTWSQGRRTQIQEHWGLIENTHARTHNFKRHRILPLFPLSFKI